MRVRSARQMVLGDVVGTSWSSKSRPTQGTAHRPGQPFLILNIESYAAARGRGGGGCGVVEVDYGDGPGTVQEQTTPDDRAEDGNPRGADKKRNKRERQR